MYDNEIYSGENKPVTTGAGEEGTGNQDGQNRYFDTLNNNPPYQEYASRSSAYTAPAEPVVKAKKAKKTPGFFKKTMVAICLGLVFGACGGLGFYGVTKVTGVLDSKLQKVEKQIDNSGSNNTASTEVKPVIKETQPTAVIKSSNDVSTVVDEVMPAMVSIVNTATEETRFWGQTYTREYESSGSGIIISENENELLVVTNHHVADGATKLEVTFIDGEKAEAKIKGMNSDMDLAVIAINLKDLKNSTRESIAIAKLGDSDDLKLGKPVIVIGNALGYGQSVTNGIISGLNRELQLEDGSTGTFIQTNAAVNPGNSGGALLNESGEVIGIVSNKIGGTTVEGMGYAIPISAANPIIADLMSHQTRGDKVAESEMGYMGVYLQTISDEVRQYYGLSVPQGVFVKEVIADGAADKAGMKYGDYIIKIEGEKVSTSEGLIGLLQYYKAGDTIKVTVNRLIEGEYTEKELTLTLGTKPEE